MRLESEAGQLHPEGGRLRVDAVRAPHAHRVHVLARAAYEGVAVETSTASEQQPRLAQLQGQSGVQDVRGSQSVVQPAPRLADGLRDHVDEGGNVVARYLLALLHGLDAEGGAVADLGGVVLRHDALLGQTLHYGQLHLEPGLELALLGPDGAHLGPRVALDHASRILPASTAAFMALSTPTQATS